MAIRYRLMPLLLHGPSLLMVFLLFVVVVDSSFDSSALLSLGSDINRDCIIANAFVFVFTGSMNMSTDRTSAIAEFIRMS